MHSRLRLAPFALFAAAIAGCEDPSARDIAPPGPPPVAAAPWPAPHGYDLDADVRLREALAGKHFAGEMHTQVSDGVFVIASNRDWLLADSVRLTHDALAALLDGRFSQMPTRAVTVYALTDEATFAELCGDRVGAGCARWLGAWIKETREILVDQGPGRASLVHELVHPLIAADLEAATGAGADPDAVRAPRWLREGISALYEQPILRGKEIHGATNWRLADLQAALASPEERDLVHLDALFRMPDDLFDGEHGRAAYAVARFACQYWDSAGQDKLWKFWHAWTAQAASDPTAEQSFTAVFGQTPHDADAAWQTWVRSLRRGG